MIIDLQWFTFHYFINELKCKKVFLIRQVDKKFFKIKLQDRQIIFKPENYNKIIAVEPLSAFFSTNQINPIVIRNKNEIFSKNKAIKLLGLNNKKKKCLFAFNGKPSEFKQTKKQFSYLEDVGYSIIYSTNYFDGLFPVVDYFNAFDLIICGAGYNSFWEAIYFQKNAIFVPFKRYFENQFLRVNKYIDYRFKVNGADQLVDIILNL